jgi:hypothetical protein
MHWTEAIPRRRRRAIIYVFFLIPPIGSDQVALFWSIISLCFHLLTSFNRISNPD